VGNIGFVGKQNATSDICSIHTKSYHSVPVLIAFGLGLKCVYGLQRQHLQYVHKRVTRCSYLPYIAFSISSISHTHNMPPRAKHCVCVGIIHIFFNFLHSILNVSDREVIDFGASFSVKTPVMLYGYIVCVCM
jgi:hypothetical protein